MIPECDGCPWKHWPVRCHAAEVGHRRYCQLLAEGRTDYAGIIERKTLGTEPKPTPLPPEKVNAGRLVLTVLAHRRACPAWTQSPACGCTGECGREGKPLVPSIDDCRECLSADHPLHQRDDADHHQNPDARDELIR